LEIVWHCVQIGETTRNATSASAVKETVKQEGKNRKMTEKEKERKWICIFSGVFYLRGNWARREKKEKAVQVVAV